MKEKTKILVVDDDTRSQKLVEAMLTPRGYEVVTAETGEKGIALVRETKPALILLDVMMPVTDGYTALSMIKNDPDIKNIPVIMVTALGFELNKRLADELGAAGYVTKPVILTELLAEINRCLLAI